MLKKLPAATLIQDNNHSMLEILVYLFENYMESGTHLCAPEEEVTTSLRSAGYFSGEIQQALNWLAILNNPIPASFDPGHSFAMRHYSANEKCCLGKKGVDFLVYLQKMAIIDASTREVIIDRAVALWRSRIPLNHLKWVALIVLFSRKTDKTDKKDFFWVQDLILQHRQLKTVH